MNKPKRFRVRLTGQAFMSQTQWVEAKDIEEAKQIALNHYNDNVWEYDEINEKTIEIESADEN